MLSGHEKYIDEPTQGEAGETGFSAIKVWYFYLKVVDSKK
jgi:hypothetical protein